MQQVKILNNREVWDILQTIPDPEVPAISIVELGVVRNVEIINADSIKVQITPTYSGCPALKTMEDDVKEKLHQQGFTNVEIETIYKPAWTTDWLNESTKQKLKEYGIAPPAKLTIEHLIPLGKLSKQLLACPFCDSDNTALTSHFGSTACKALYFCNTCHQPFEHFKCH